MCVCVCVCVCVCQMTDVRYSKRNLLSPAEDFGVAMCSNVWLHTVLHVQCFSAVLLLLKEQWSAVGRNGQ